MNFNELLSEANNALKNFLGDEGNRFRPGRWGTGSLRVLNKRGTRELRHPIPNPLSGG